MLTFFALLVICAGNSPVTGEFPSQRPVKLSFDVFFDLRLNKRLSKQWWGWWFETLSRPVWRHCYVWYDSTSLDHSVVTCSNEVNYIDSLWHSDAIWRHRSGSTLAQVMACSLTVPRYCLNQCRFQINEIQWRSHESNLSTSVQATVLYTNFEKHTFAIMAISPRGKWVKQIDLN